MTPTKEQARAAMSRIVDSMSDCTDCVAVIDYIVALEQAVGRLIWNTPLLDDCLRCPALCDKCATNAGSDACLESLREWAMREPEQEES